MKSSRNVNIKLFYSYFVLQLDKLVKKRAIFTANTSYFYTLTVNYQFIILDYRLMIIIETM